MFLPSGDPQGIRQAEITTCIGRLFEGEGLLAGVLMAADEQLVCTQDYVFKSPSAAAAILVGNNMKGWVSWKTKDGKTARRRSEASHPGLKGMRSVRRNHFDGLNEAGTVAPWRLPRSREQLTGILIPLMMHLLFQLVFVEAPVDER